MNKIHDTSKSSPVRSPSRFTSVIGLVPFALAFGACGEDTKSPNLDAGVVNVFTDAASATNAATAPALDAAIVLSFTPNWHEHIAPLVSEKCSACHRPEGIGPFSVQTYEATRAFARLMASAVERGSMPPFLAQETADCTPVNRFAADARLRAEQKALLRAWADADAPLGDAQKAKPLVPPLSTALEREDVVMHLPEPIVVEKNSKGDIHTCVVVDPKLDKDVYVTKRQVTSGNDKVLHHLVSYVVKPLKTDNTPATKAQMDEALRTKKGAGIGQRYDCFGGPGLESSGLQFEMLGGWAPGTQPIGSPPNSGQPVAKDSLVVLDVHYHPLNSGPELDSKTKLSLQLADSVPGLIARPVLLGNVQSHADTPFGVADLAKTPGEAVAEFKIPPNANHHVEEMSWQWRGLSPSGLRVYYASTHMHYVGTDMMIRLDNTTPQAGEPPSECLVHTPKWDFNWQGRYYYDAPYEKLPQMNNGDVLRLRCVFDNHRGNSFLSKALDEQGKADPIEVRLGEDTLDEMCLASLGIVYPNTAVQPAAAMPK